MRVVSLGLGLLLLACGGTGRTRLTFPVEVAGRATAPVTDSGWSVTLTRAVVPLEVLRFFEGRVAVAQRPTWWRSLLVGEAWAHPGHYLPGAAVGELIAPLELDLLAGAPMAWGEASAVTGPYGSAQLTFGAAGLSLAGIARKAGAADVPFTAQVPVPVADAIRFEHEMTTAPGALRLEWDLGVVLSRVDFSQVGASAIPLDPQSPAFNGLSRGVADASGFVVTWSGE